MKRGTVCIAVLILTGSSWTHRAHAQADAPKPAEPAKPAEPTKPSELPRPAKLTPPASVADDGSKPRSNMKAQLRPLGDENAAAGSTGANVTPEHRNYAMLVGEWKVAVSYHGFPGGAPPSTKGRIKFESVLGGRFLMETAQTDTANTGYEWVGIYGYNPKSKKYSAVWVDNESDNNDTATGTYDEALKTFTFNGEQDNPQGTGKSLFKWTIRFHPPDELTVEMFEPDPDGKDKLVMRITGSKK